MLKDILQPSIFIEKYNLASIQRIFIASIQTFLDTFIIMHTLNSKGSSHKALKFRQESARYVSQNAFRSHETRGFRFFHAREAGLFRHRMNRRLSETFSAEKRVYEF